MEAQYIDQDDYYLMNSDPELCYSCRKEMPRTVAATVNGYVLCRDCISEVGDTEF